jgi:cytoskeleton protein RodZ
VSEPNRSQPFDERAALEELERLAEKIQSSRRQRAQAVDEFDAFVRGFKHDRWTGPERRAPEPPLRSQPIADREAVMPPPPEIAPRETIDAPDLAPVVGTPVTPDAPVVPVAPTWSDMMRQPIARWTLAAVGVLALVLLLWRPWAAVPAGPAPQAAAPAATPSEPSSSPAPALAPPPAPKPARAVNVELVTLRPVWTRVTVDDRKEVERELPANQRFSFGADRSIIVRAGDAGGMRIILDGKDLGVLGRDGQIASRTFSAPGVR